jgi:hypothetical protein
MTIYNSEGEFYDKIGSREAWQPTRLDKLMIGLGTEKSARKASNILDKLSEVGKRVNPTTFRNQLERQGTQIAATISKKLRRRPM